LLRSQRTTAALIIATISTICFSLYLCRDRNRIERFFNQIKQCRWVATRYNKLAAN
jgi:transposase